MTDGSEKRNRQLACVAGERAKERTGAREGDTQSGSPSRAPVFSCAHYFQAPATLPNRQLAFELQNSHVCEKPSKNVVLSVDA